MCIHGLRQYLAQNELFQDNDLHIFFYDWIIMNNKNDFQILENARKAIESVGGRVEVIYNLDEPDIIVKPGKRAYKQIGMIYLEECNVTETVFEAMSHLNRVCSIFFCKAVFDEEHLKYLKNIEIYLLDLRSCKISNSGLKYIGEMNLIDTLWLSDNSFDDEGLKNLSRLVNIRQLALENNSISSEGIVCLSNFSDLNSIILKNTKVNDNGIQKLVRSCMHLRAISLSNTCVGNEGIASLSSLPELESLRICNLEIDDNAIKDFSRLENLYFLLLENTKITDCGVESLAGASRLETLDLSGTMVTDKCVDFLLSFQCLKILSLDRTNVTKYGCEYIKEKKPSLIF